MKKLILLSVILFSIQIGYAQKDKLAVGLYSSVSHQNINYVNGSDFLKPNGSYFTSSEFGILFQYGLNETFLLNFCVGFGQTHVLLNDDIISSFQYDKIPVSFSIKTELFEKSGLSVYIENGVRGVYCDSYGYIQIINPDKSGFILSGSIGAYDVAESISYGLINGLGFSYRFDCDLEIGVSMRYYSGLNKVWENNQIFVKTQDEERMYSLNSFGSSLDLSLAVCYNF